MKNKFSSTKLTADPTTASEFVTELSINSGRTLTNNLPISDLAEVTARAADAKSVFGTALRPNLSSISERRMLGGHKTR